MRIRYILFLGCIFFSINCFSQKKASVVIQLKSPIPDTIYSKETETILIDVRNLSSHDIQISNVPALNIDYEVLIKKGNDYLAIDSICKILPQPVFPKEGIINRNLKHGQKIEIRYFFPPTCCFAEAGDYKIRFLFGYHIGAKNYLVKSDWYRITCVF